MTIPGLHIYVDVMPHGDALSRVFGDPASPYFVGFQWARRMREFAAEGFLVSHPDPKDANACHSWSVAQ
jgi:hypothetical protein